MSQWIADSFLLPVSGYPAPSARWKLPLIFSSNRIWRVKWVMPALVPMANSHR